MVFVKELMQGKRALITGGGSGIGKAITELFLRCGASVLIASRKEQRLQQCLEDLGSPANLHYVVCDIRDKEQVSRLTEEVADKLGGLDILVNNAGGQFPSLAEDITLKGWDAVINNNLNGPWYVTQSMANRFFIPQRSGTVLFIIMSIFRGFPGMAHSAAARGGVETLAKSLAVEWSKYEIRINCIAPGIIDSSGLMQYPEELKRGISDSIPLKKLGKVEDIANLAAFLCSSAGGYITGETIYVDGGQRLWGDLFKM